MTQFKPSYFSVSAMIMAACLLLACGSEKDNQSHLSGVNVESDFEGCPRDIAAAIAPFDSDYGECRMSDFNDICGPDNRAKGLSLIAEVRESELNGLNPWLWACARTGNTRNTLIAGCTYRFRETTENCACGVDEYLSQKTDDQEFVDYFAVTFATDAPYAKKRFGKWQSFGPESRMSEAHSELNSLGKAFETCGISLGG